MAFGPPESPNDPVFADDMCAQCGALLNEARGLGLPEDEGYCSTACRTDGLRAEVKRLRAENEGLRARNAWMCSRQIRQSRDAFSARLAAADYVPTIRRLSSELEEYRRQERERTSTMVELRRLAMATGLRQEEIIRLLRADAAGQREVTLARLKRILREDSTDPVEGESPHHAEGE